MRRARLNPLLGLINFVLVAALKEPIANTSFCDYNNLLKNLLLIRMNLPHVVPVLREGRKSLMALRGGELCEQFEKRPKAKESSYGIVGLRILGVDFITNAGQQHVCSLFDTLDDKDASLARSELVAAFWL